MVPFEEPPQRSDDIGMGTGIWAIDIVQVNNVPPSYYPYVKVIGMLLLSAARVPRCRFEIDDAEAA